MFAPTASGVLETICCIIVVCQSRHFRPQSKFLLLW
jgi:hypothetical protein